MIVISEYINHNPSLDKIHGIIEKTNQEHNEK